MSEMIYHIATRTAWTAGQKSGEYRADSLEQVGFIHCSKIGQILRVANNAYAGQSELVILVIDPSKLVAEIRWEPGTDKPDELFPHIYGPLNHEAVVGVVNFEPGPTGEISLPAGLT